MFICDNCEYKGLALGEKHTKKHTVVRVPEGCEKLRSTEERLQFLEDEMTKMGQNLVEVRQTVAEMRKIVVEMGQTVVEMRQALGTVVEKDGGWCRSELLTTGDLHAAAIGVESVQSKKESGTM